MGNYFIQEAREENLSDILELYNHYVLNTICTFHTKPLTLEHLKEIIFPPQKKYKSFVIYDRGKFCGYVLLSQHKKREAYDGTAEVSVYLKTECIGKGLGSLALQHIEQYARREGFHVLTATICGENDRSIKLFEKNGYVKCAHYKEVGRKFKRWLDMVAYQKILN